MAIDDWILLRWTLNVALGCVLSLLLLPGILAGAWFWVSSSHAGSGVLAVLGGILVGLAGAAFLFAFGTSGSHRGIDILVLIVMISLIEPLFGRMLDTNLRLLLHAALLPLVESARLPAHLVEGNWSAASHAAAHLAGWCTVLLGVGLLMLRCWRPAAERPH